MTRLVKILRIGNLNLQVHFKMLIFDFETAYIGSANLTGASIGMKSGHRRNFEAGILIDESALIDCACEQFYNVWRGKYCNRYGRKAYCSDPIKYYRVMI